MIKASPIRKSQTATAATIAKAACPPPRRPNAQLVHAVLQRKEDERARKPGGCHCESCAGKAMSWLQRKLAIGSAHDPLEREADRAAAQLPARAAATAAGSAPIKLQRAPASFPDSAATAPDSVQKVIASAGRPLDAPVRQDMEQHFGHDFSQVRIHEGAAAAQSARDVGARAYTVGPNIAFAAGQFAPAGPEGRRLLAHELAHVVQQGAGAWLQRQQAPVASKPGTGPTTVTESRRDSAMMPAPDKGSAAVPVSGKGSATVPVSGKGSATTTGSGKGSATATGSGKGSATATGSVKGSVTPKDVPKYCGPEVSYWIVGQAGKAKSNATVVAIKDGLSAANTLAAKYDTTVQAAVEAGAALRIKSTESSLKKAGTVPPGVRPTADIEAGLMGAVGFAANVAVDFSGSDAKIKAVKEIYGKVTKAAADWQALVGHEADYDFKTNAMSNPRAGGCPSAGCSNTVTIGGGPNLGDNYLSPGFGGPGNCYLTDVPGNLLYALIGKFVGFSERALQLGSQWAQLTSKAGAKWDPPQDTASISVGYSLPLSLTASAVRSAVAGNRGSLNARPDCLDCTNLTTAGYK